VRFESLLPPWSFYTLMVGGDQENSIVSFPNGSANFSSKYAS
jgi:hypothetical protein